jgi:protein SCO1/2
MAGVVIVLFSQCESRKLPILGEKMEENGKIIYHTIANFSFTDQENQTITNQALKGKIYIADFFYATCPTICPIVKRETIRVYDKFKGNPDVIFISHTLDPRHDTVAFLKQYAENLGADAKQWHFLTGEKEKIYEIGQKSYLVTAKEDKNEPGGILHDGALILVDREGRIRGLYDGTKPAAVDKLIADIPTLLEEK